jgi:hypothetical protein
MYSIIGIVFLNILLLIEIVFGYFHTRNDFFMNGDLDGYYNSLIKFDVNLVIFYLLLYVLTHFYLKKHNTKLFTLLIIAMAGINLIVCLWFVIKNIYLNYYEISEINIFTTLILEYGSLINIVYIAPLILSIFYFILLIFFEKKYKNKGVKVV